MNLDVGWIISINIYKIIHIIKSCISAFEKRSNSSNLKDCSCPILIYYNIYIKTTNYKLQKQITTNILKSLIWDESVLLIPRPRVFNYIIIKTLTFNSYLYTWSGAYKFSSFLAWLPLPFCFLTNVEYYKF